MELGDARTRQDVGSKAAEANKKPLKVYLQKTIGMGSFGHVRYCKAVVGNKHFGFAVKIICKYSSKYQFNRGLVEREVSILKKVRHANLVKFLRLLDNQYYVYMYMEYCKNGDMRRLIEKNGPYAEPTARVLFAQVVAAVEYLHGLDVAHRDLKPENVLLDHRDRVKVTDFGLANFCRDANTGNGRTLLYTRCGTRDYMPPEVLRNVEEGYNAMFFDIWSMGCLLHYMLVGQNAFDSDSRLTVRQQASGDIVLFRPTFDRAVSAPAKRLLRRMLEPDVLKRARIPVIKRSRWMTASRSS